MSIFATKILRDMQKKETLGVLIRFGNVGTISTGIHYAICWILQHR